MSESDPVGLYLTINGKRHWLGTAPRWLVSKLREKLPELEVEDA